MLREQFDRLLEDTTLLTIAFAIALGWSIYQLARGVATFIDDLTVHLPAPDANGFGSGFGSSGVLSWVVGRSTGSLSACFNSHSCWPRLYLSGHGFPTDESPTWRCGNSDEGSVAFSDVPLRAIGS